MPSESTQHRPAKLSGCVIAFMEADRIAGCLESLAFCDEVVVVDSGSTDATREIAAKHGARVVVNAPFPGMSQQRQVSVDQATHDWVLCLDADERVTPALRAEIEGLRAEGFRGAAYEMPRANHYLGRVVRHGLFNPDRKVRLFDRRQAVCRGTNPHDRVELLPGGELRRLRGALEHLSFRSLQHHLRSIDNYTRVAAATLKAQGRRGAWWDLLVRPPAVVCKSLVVKLGFLDGWRGLLISGLAGYYDWLKYWRLRQTWKS
ncbi:MAG: glycosyltransferase family 2 protein [Planctomycetes bacterium]|nr:glycosyltransferase family 2 protein [Planctomycetota bacterium]